MNIYLRWMVRKMTEDELDMSLGFDKADLKREIGSLNKEYDFLEKKKIEILLRLKRVHRDIKENRAKVEKFVGFIREQQAQGEKVD